MLRRLSRGTMLAGLLLATVLAGLVGFTALGLGGDDRESAKATPVPRVKRTPYAPSTTGSPELKRSESIGRRQAGGQGDPNAQVLSENVPFDPAQFKAPIASFRRYAGGQVRRLQPEVAELAAAIRRGDRPAARAAWRRAFARYLRLGAVYGLLGDLDARIDGVPGGLPRGERDPHFIGLHRIEKALWTNEPVRSMVPIVAGLRRDVAKLEPAVRTAEIDPVDYVTRTHEILEGAQRDFVSGTNVPWSQEGVLATASGVAATRFALASLRPLLQGQDSEPANQAGMDRLDHTLAGLRAAHGGRLPTLDELTRRQRQRLIGSLGWSLERLQAVPHSLETQDPPPVPLLKTTP